MSQGSLFGDDPLTPPPGETEMFLARWLQINARRPEWVASVERQIETVRRKHRILVGVTPAGVVFSARNESDAQYLREALTSFWARYDLRNAKSTC